MENLTMAHTRRRTRATHTFKARFQPSGSGMINKNYYRSLLLNLDLFCLVVVLYTTGKRWWEEFEFPCADDNSFASFGSSKERKRREFGIRFRSVVELDWNMYVFEYINAESNFWKMFLNWALNLPSFAIRFEAIEVVEKKFKDL